MLQDTQGGLQFSIYYPQQVAPRLWYRFYVYVFRPTAESAVRQDAQALSNLDKFLQIEVAEDKRPQGLRTAPMLLAPHLEGAHFIPEGRRRRSYADWFRSDFQMRVPSTPINQFSTVVITCDVDGVIVADIPFQVYVTEHPEEDEYASTTQRCYQAPYCSYSSQDISIVERIERAATFLELDYLYEVLETRRKSKGSAETLALIDRADLFQLFWSEASAQSDDVEKEWRHALQLGRPNFIRPIYWFDPMPPPPQELADLVFTRKFGLWIELKYDKTPIEHLSLSEQELNKWRREGITVVSEVMELLESNYLSAVTSPGPRGANIDSMRNALAAIGVNLLEQLK